ncbi:DUF5677 domain-containing protein [Thomasclavelia saccharogumia]|uniref:DUF5677 domain-containing protein n=1 Tax=Thomasclavelia saccharogumia TaxID=341225 RepID=UPI00047D5CD6|nr:DUF5677 domain-containing protein [Thomasclavelia saccharogumia]
MDKIKLSKHVKHSDTFYTPFTDPTGMGALLSLSSWAKCWLPEFLWIGLIIHEQGRKKGFENLYQIIKQLKDFEIAMPQMSQIFTFEKSKQELFWQIVTQYVEKDVLTPLTVVITPDINIVFYNYFFNFSMNIDDSISKLLTICKECNRFHDEMTTDISFIVEWFYILNGKLQISSELDLLPKALNEYYKHFHEDKIMSAYRPIIRAAFQGLCELDCKKSFSKSFWQLLGEISECNPLKILWERNESMDFYKMATNVIEYFSVSNEDKKMNVKYSVIMGMTCYIYRVYQEIVEKQMQNDIGGRILFRTMLETYINLKYMIMQESKIPDIYERYKAYGNGKYKLVMSKLREQKYTVSEDSQLDKKYLELVVNEDMDEAFINMSVGYFDKSSIRTKFQKCGENELYEIYYEYATNFTHGMWGAIRESSMLICDNPAHTYHVVPDYYGEQNLRSVLSDSEMVMRKTFDIIASYVEMPDFYI